MAYTKQTWATGDTITADKLNHLEDGVAGAGGVMVVGATFDESTNKTTLDHTWQEINAALSAGIPCFSHDVSVEGESSLCPIIRTNSASTAYSVQIIDQYSGELTNYKTSSPDGYPSTDSFG